jgi:predicted RNase H-like HicB family nuclease
MKSSNIVHSSAWTPSVFVSSGSPLKAKASVLQTRAENIFAIAVPAPAAVISSNRIAASRLTSNRRQRSQWLEAQSSVSVVEPVRAPSPPPQQTGTGTPDFVAKAASAEALPKPSRTERIELAIDSLQNYDLIKPIPVLIESLGDKVFVAEAPDLNVSTTGNSVGAAFLLLKDHIITTYEGYRSKKGLDSERTRQLGIFDKYIGKAKRHWF